MGKTYEALEWAEKEFQANRLQALPKALPPVQAKLPVQVRTHPTRERYQDLRANLLTRYPDGSIKTILFAGTGHGEGTSTTAVNFATTLAVDDKLQVLLIDVNLRRPSLHGVFKVDSLHGLSDLVIDGREAPIPIKVGPGNLYLVPCGRPHSEPVRLLESDGFREFLQKMRDTYDYVILDCPPVHGSSEHRVLSARVDGVVLVIEAGKTHRQVAFSAKKQLEEAGAKLLGVVMNKRKYYIPEFIYRRL